MRFERDFVAEIRTNLTNEMSLIHVITGPRQVGKSFAAGQIADLWQGPVHMVAADLPLPPGPEWIETQWEIARNKGNEKERVLLILDEIQKVRGWSEVLKFLWDQEQRKPGDMSVLVLGSSSLLLQEGLSESLTGRFFLYRCPHWKYAEMRDAFGWDLSKWIYFGGYPGCVDLIANETNWKRYVIDSLVETVLSRDILQMQKVFKPALLRHLFGLASAYPAQILSYNKMLGQLQDAGNTTTLAHYLKLLETAYLASGLEAFRQGRTVKRGSSPKLLLWNNALVNALQPNTFAETSANRSLWGRLVENAVGAHLLNHRDGLSYEVCHWRKGNSEVDFVVKTTKQVWALEVKSGRSKYPRGLADFKKAYPDSKAMIIGPGNFELEDFLLTHPRDMFR